MQAPLRRLLGAPNPFTNGRALEFLRTTPLSSRRWLRVIFAVAAIAIVLNVLVLHDRSYVDSLPSQILGNQAFHPKPFAPAPHGLESHDDNGLDYWTWETKSQFYRKEDIDWNVGIMDECFLFPRHLLSKIQVVLKTGVADDWTRTDAQLSTMVKCIPQVLVVSDADHKYGKYKAVDVLAKLQPQKYFKEKEYLVYEAQKNASRDGVKLEEGPDGWSIDKYKFLPQVEEAIRHNPKAEWYVFMESDTYFFWDNVFRLLENYDASLPYYFGSPSSGKKYPSSADSEHEEQLWFAYGGSGFILSAVAAHRLVDRPSNSLGVQGRRLTAEYEEDIRNDCCGDSVLGWALHDKAAVDLSGLWPMFNPHRLEDIPFGSDYWCQPVISLHKSSPRAFKELWAWENKPNPRNERPILYSDLLFSFHGNFSQREDWDAAFDAGFQLDDNSTVHTSLAACEAGCFAHNECRQYTWHGHHCYYARSLYIGSAKQPDGYHDEVDRKYVSGWDLNKIQTLSIENQCADGPHWVKPSTKRKY